MKFIIGLSVNSCFVYVFVQIAEHVLHSCIQRIVKMFSLVHGFWKYWLQKEEYYIIILGLDGAGKTSFLEQAKCALNPSLRGVNLAKISSTVGLNIGKIVIDGIILNFWDLGGQADLRCLWEKVRG